MPHGWKNNNPILVIQATQLECKEIISNQNIDHNHSEGKLILFGGHKENKSRNNVEKQT